MQARVVYAPAALDDLDAILDWIDKRAGPQVATRYVDRLHAACDKLTLFSKRGTPREALGAGIRSVAFERRATIFYRIEADVVRIVHVLHRGRDVEQAFGCE